MISKKNKVRPLKLPEGSYKATFRIRGGFNASRFSHFQLSKLLFTAAGLPATMELCQDVVTINPTTNTVTLSTESYGRLTKYLAIKSLMVNGQEHEVTSYSVPNTETCKGIIYIDRMCALRIKRRPAVDVELWILRLTMCAFRSACCAEEAMRLDPFSVDKAPPSPEAKPRLPTKKKGPSPKKKQEDHWPSLPAAPPSNKSSPPQNDDQSTTMDTSPPPTIGNSTKRKPSDDSRDAWEEHDKLSRKMAAHSSQV
ncbi:hypothetical protein HPB52_019285 [Rhipicephalus sanguineus]|uniref:Uncharacterized protein n=1 Tax=Rhipicephalus sanguineus TaxID=34632 RepID=A0A9D4QF85_RHISA|nr:hypothetical protein HPB52_019285 [Rhipicephalus sanguineus]